MADSTGTTSYSYTDRNELASMTSPTGRIVSYSYGNAAGRRSSMTLSNYGTWSYGYDDGGRVTSVAAPNNETTTYSFDHSNRVSLAVLPNGTRAEYAYSSRNFLTSITNRFANLNLLSSYAYTLDNTGRRTRMTEGNGDYTDYTHDNAYQLTREWKRDWQNATLYDYSYTYDAGGNRLTKTVVGQGTTNYSYDGINRMTAAGNVSYTYDDNGNMLTATSGGQTTTLQYSYENELTQITYPNQTVNTFQYNGAGLRWSKVDSAGTTRFIYDGDRLLAELDGTNALVAAHTAGVSQRRNGVSRFYHFDGLGSTRQLTDASQNVTDAYAYDSFGNVTGQTGSTPNPAKYVGRLGYYSDGDSGLMLLGHRYYDPGAGRFITLDPIKDGINWYAYCENDPVNAVDPEGLSWQDHWKWMREMMRRMYEKLTGQKPPPMPPMLISPGADGIWMDDPPKQPDPKKMAAMAAAAAAALAALDELDKWRAQHEAHRQHVRQKKGQKEGEEDYMQPWNWEQKMRELQEEQRKAEEALRKLQQEEMRKQQERQKKK